MMRDKPVSAAFPIILSVANPLPPSNFTSEKLGAAPACQAEPATPNAVLAVRTISIIIMMSSTEEGNRRKSPEAVYRPEHVRSRCQMVDIGKAVLVIITKRDALDSSFDAATGLCDFYLSNSAPTSEVIANAINRVRAAVMLEAILGGQEPNHGSN